MKCWPSIPYLVYRESREAVQKARAELLAHCRSCGCIVCQVRLVTMNEAFEVDPVGEHGGEEKVLLKESLN